MYVYDKENQVLQQSVSITDTIVILKWHDKILQPGASMISVGRVGGGGGRSCRQA